MRGLAVAPLPALVATLYLTSSRGGWVAAAIAIVVLLALTRGAGRQRQRWSSAGAASAGAVAVLLARDELVDSPLKSSVAESQGPKRSPPDRAPAAPPRARLRPARARCPLPAPGEPASRDGLRGRARRGRPRRRGRRRSGGALRQLQGDPAGASRCVGSGAPLLDERQRPLAVLDVGGRRVEEHPLVGRGAGSYEAWWAEHAIHPDFRARRALALPRDTRRARLVGLALLVAFIVSGLVTGARRLGGRTEGERAAVAALLAARRRLPLRGGHRLDVGADGRLARRRPRARPARGPGDGARLTPAQTPGPPARKLPLLRMAAAASRSGSSSPRRFRCSQPWRSRGARRPSSRRPRRGPRPGRVRPRASSPGRLLPTSSWRSSRSSAAGIDEARGSIENAIAHDQDDWRLWLVAARIQTKAGAIAEARESLARARELNPKSELFTG